MKRIILFLFITCLLISCFSGAQKPKEDVIFVSILPLKYFTDKIVGDLYKVEVMVPPGVGPESYSPTPRQMTLLGEAKAFFSVGCLGFEQTLLANLKSINQAPPLFSTSTNINLIQEETEHDGHQHVHGVDPHIWSSPRNARMMAQNIFDAMVKIDADNRENYQANLEKLLIEIDRVDSTITRKLSGNTTKTFLIFHPALGYFARDYGLQQLSIEFEGKEPSPKHLQRVIEIAKAEKIKTILIQKEFDQENAAIIAKEIEGKVIQIDPLDYDWPAQMIHIAGQLSLQIQ